MQNWSNEELRTKNVKCSIAVSLKNETNALFKLISLFALRDLNILKLESRPACCAPAAAVSGGSTRRHWDLFFFVEFEPADSQAVNIALLQNLAEFCVWVSELGTYEQTVAPSPVAYEENDDVLRSVLGH